MKEKTFKKGIPGKLLRVLLSLAMVFTLILPVSAKAEKKWVKYEGYGMTVWYSANDCSFSDGYNYVEIQCNTCIGWFYYDPFLEDWFNTTECDHITTAGLNGGLEHFHHYANKFTFDGENHWHECTAEGATEECRVLVPHTIKVRTNEEQTASTASCRECGAYLTLSATSGTTEHTVGDCVEIESNVPGAQTLTPRIRNLDTKEIVKRNCKEEGNYQASLEVDGQYLIADFTLTNPKTTAATGDNRPIELLFAGFAAMSLLAAAAFTMDRKRG